MNSPLVSIVIPVYNGANYLREAIESALAQTYNNIEIIVINDGSIDETESIALSFGTTIRYFKKNNGGVASALNLGISEMRGEYFSWLSHDDLYKPEKIEKQITFLFSQENKRSLIFSGFDTIDKNSTFIKTHTINEYQQYNKFEMILYTRVHGCTLLIPKIAFDEAGYFDEALETVQDNHMWLRIAKSGYEFIYLNEALIFNRIHNEQGSVTLKEIQISEVSQFYAWASHYVKDEIKHNERLKRFVSEQF